MLCFTVDTELCGISSCLIEKMITYLALILCKELVALMMNYFIQNPKAVEFSHLLGKSARHLDQAALECGIFL